MEHIDITVGEIISVGFAIFGLGFAGWAFALRRALKVLDTIGNTLSSHAVRIARLETINENFSELLKEVKEEIRHRRTNGGSQ